MATKDHDTDPSTPKARRPSRARVHFPPPSRAVDTEPGLGAGAATYPPPSAPLGIIVPSAGAHHSEMAAALMREPDEILALSPQAEPMKKDSVEVLLDGMSEPTPNRTKTTPQTDGQASAAYHGAHSVRPPGPRLRDDGPKVLVDRPPTPVTVRVPRSTLEAIGASSSNATVGTAARSAARIWLAFFAGIAVVLAIFAVFYFTSPGEPPSLSALGAAAVTDLGDRPTGGASTSSTSTPGNELPPPQAARAPGADSGGTSTAKAPAPANVSRSTSTQGRRLRPTAPADDLGEFKTAF